jgi:hypothetical protein
MSLQHLQDIALDYFQALGTPVALSRAIQLRYRDWEGIARASVDPVHYIDAKSYRLDVLACTFFKKVKDLPSGIDTRQAALTEWFDSERQCYQANLRLDDDHACYRNEGFFLAIRKNFYKLVGRPPAGMQDIRFGPGSTFEVRGKHIAIPDKIATQPIFTTQASTYLYDYLCTGWGRRNAGSPWQDSPLLDVALISEKLPARGGADAWVGQLRPIRVALSRAYELVDGNRWDTAPKNTLVDRSIGIEPGGNMVYQKVCGNKMRRSLNRFGLLLRPQKVEGKGDWFAKTGRDSQQIHRKLAKQASVDGTMATQDVRKASDTMCRAFVQYGTGRWFKVLDELRSRKTLVEGRWYCLEKFSSMGNGFTFELETALFAAIAMTIADAKGIELIPTVNFSVYGDDIIVPTEMSEEMVSALAYCGFEVNTSKSYSSGPFRESCGGDYYNGSPVRGLYLKKVPESVGDWITLHNLLKRAEEFVSLPSALDKVRSRIPVSCRNYGPVAFGDTVLHHQRWPEKAKLKRAPSQEMLIQITVPVVEEYPLDRWDTLSVVTSKLYGMDGDRIAMRGDPISYHTKWVSYG